MSLCTSNFATGTNGNVIATTDTGAATAWDAVLLGAPGNVQYDNAHGAPPTASLMAKITGTGQAQLEWSTALGTVTDYYTRYYLYATSYGGAGFDILRSNNGGSGAAFIFLNSTGKIELRDATNSILATSTTTIALNQLVRLEWHIINSATVGQMEVKIYQTSINGTSPDETLTTTANKNTAAQTTKVDFGPGVSRSNTWWIGNVVTGASAYPGPSPVVSTAPTVSGSAPVGSTLTCNGGSWNATFTLSYQWTRNGSNIGGATSSTYVTQAGDAGAAIGCTVTATGQQATNEAASSASSNTVTPTGAAGGPLADKLSVGISIGL